MIVFVFCVNKTATTEIYTYLHTLSLHDALPISRTGKQLCHRDDGPTHVGSVDLADNINSFTNLEQRKALFGQGCKPGSLYDDAAFGTPNGLSYSFILGAIALKQTGTGIGAVPGVYGEVGRASCREGG